MESKTRTISWSWQIGRGWKTQCHEENGPVKCPKVESLKAYLFLNYPHKTLMHHQASCGMSGCFIQYTTGSDGSFLFSISFFSWRICLAIPLPYRAFNAFTSNITYLPRRRCCKDRLALQTKLERIQSSPALNHCSNNSAMICRS